MAPRPSTHLILSILVLGLIAPRIPAEDSDATIRAEVALVNVIFSAVDRNNRLVRGLKAEDFLVLEDKQPQAVEFFSELNEANDIPLTVALLIDTSGSVKKQLASEEETASEFFSQVLRKGKDIGLIIQFDSEVNLVQDFTDDPQLLINALNTLQVGTSTSMYDAIYVAVVDKLKSKYGRKVIVVITDGDDNSSKITKAEAIALAQKNDILIYGIGVRGAFGANFGVLKKFAEETGAAFFSPNAKFAEIQAAFRAIGEDLRDQYSLAYSSSNKKRDGTFRAIQVQTKVSGLRVRTRKGYYAPGGPGGE